MEMGEPVHLTYEDMTAYVDAKIDDAARERMNEHAAICKSCSKELRDLQVFDARMNVEMNMVPAAQAEAGPSWLKQAIGNVGQFFATPRRLSFAGAGVGLMLLGVFSLLQVHVKEGAAQSGSGVMAQVTLLSASTHPEIFYGGFLIAGVGLIALLYGLFKK
jgi:anti-sigma factor RsiW